MTNLNAIVNKLCLSVYKANICNQFEIRFKKYYCHSILINKNIIKSLE